MAHISGDDRSLLLPESVDDYVGQDNVVRFIDAFVDGLDMQAAGFGRVQPKPTGQPADRDTTRPICRSVQSRQLVDWFDDESFWL